MPDKSFECRAKQLKKSVNEAAESFEAERLSATFERRVELFKKSVERAAKKYKVSLYTGYLDSCHDEHLIIGDTLDTENEVYFHTLTQEE